MANTSFSVIFFDFDCGRLVRKYQQLYSITLSTVVFRDLLFGKKN